MLTWADCEWQNVELHAMAQDSMISGSLTAQKRSSSSEDTGFVFIDCKITGTGQVYLGRAWGPYSRTVYINTYMENIIIPEGWQDWGSSQRQKWVGNTFFGNSNAKFCSHKYSTLLLKHEIWGHVYMQDGLLWTIPMFRARIRPIWACTMVAWAKWQWSFAIHATQLDWWTDMASPDLIAVQQHFEKIQSNLWKTPRR
jgi:hypothetical protein